MFDATAEQISQLSDVDLRELVARRCEAELLAADVVRERFTENSEESLRNERFE